MLYAFDTPTCGYFVLRHISRDNPGNIWNIPENMWILYLVGHFSVRGVPDITAHRQTIYAMYVCVINRSSHLLHCGHNIESVFWIGNVTKIQLIIVEMYHDIDTHPRDTMYVLYIQNHHQHHHHHPQTTVASRSIQCRDFSTIHLHHAVSKSVKNI